MSEQPSAAGYPNATTLHSRSTVNQQGGLVIPPNPSSDLSRDQQIYHDNLVQPSVPNQERRSADEAPAQEKEWEKEVAGWRSIPEDGRWQLTVAKGWLNGLSASDAKEHLQIIQEDEAKVTGPKWIRGKGTTVFDLLDDGTEYCYTMKNKSRKSNPENTDMVLNEQSSATGQLKRVIYLTSPESRRRQIVCAIGNGSKIEQCQQCPINYKDDHRMEVIKIEMSYYQIHAIKPDQYQALPDIEPWSLWDTVKLDGKPRKSDLSLDSQHQVLIKNKYTLVAVATPRDKTHWTILEMRPATSTTPSREKLSQHLAQASMIEAFMSHLNTALTEVNAVCKSNLEHFAELTTAETSIRDLDSYSATIRDDNEFTGSILYSWVSGILKNLHVNILLNIDKVKEALEHAQHLQRSCGIPLGESIRGVQEQLDTLENTARNIVTRRQQMEELLRSLLDITQVMDSHRTTQLGRIVQYLTAILVVYTPLLFLVGFFDLGRSKTSRVGLGIGGGLTTLATYVVVYFMFPRFQSLVRKYLLAPLRLLLARVGALVVETVRNRSTAQPDIELVDLEAVR